MPRFRVRYFVRGYATVFVEADSADDAETRGEDLIDWYEFEPSSVEAEEVEPDDG